MTENRPVVLALAAAALAACSHGFGLSSVSMPTERQETARAPADDRPGLGTVWGEYRRSPVQKVPFHRASESPFSVASLFYNDRAGVDAMASRERQPIATRADAPLAMRGGLEVRVVGENQQPLETYHVGERVYLVGESGQRYTLMVVNQTDRRYEIVASVDGLDVIDGLPASVGKRGYILPPWGELAIDGFRRSDNEVAAFRFGAVGESYAARIGADREVGVIGLAFFDERGAPPWSDDEIERRRGARPFAAPPSAYY